MREDFRHLNPIQLHRVDLLPHALCCRQPNSQDGHRDANEGHVLPWVPFIELVRPGRGEQDEAHSRRIAAIEPTQSEAKLLEDNGKILVRSAKTSNA